MENTKGPRPSVHRLFISANDSILLYGAEIWADATRIDKYRKEIAVVQKRIVLEAAHSGSKSMEMETIRVWRGNKI